MSLLNRRIFIALPLALVLGASACGFEPVYGPGGTGSALFGQIIIEAPESVTSSGDPNAYLLVRNLEDRLGRSTSGSYALDLTLSTRSDGQAITASNETTRYSIVGQVGYTLTRLSDGAVVASGTEDNFTGYSATGSTVETQAGEQDAYQRLMQILADQVANRLIATVDLTAAPAE